MSHPQQQRRHHNDTAKWNPVSLLTAASECFSSRARHPVRPEQRQDFIALCSAQ